MPQTSMTIRVLFIREGEAWVAQCLEHDIASQGRTLQEAEATFGRTFVGQIMLDVRRGKEPLRGISPAPRMYWRKFKEGIELKVEPTIPLPKSIPPALVIEEIRREARVA
ncbi:MAG TPA: hypothetical protein VFH31_16640 [Pyrinomonadaceae bacterium]|nr:hypothetical protein [Pyrinomonadaceae bacterium]